MIPDGHPRWPNRLLQSLLTTHVSTYVFARPNSTMRLRVTCANFTGMNITRRLSMRSRHRFDWLVSVVCDRSIAWVYSSEATNTSIYTIYMVYIYYYYSLSILYSLSIRWSIYITIYLNYSLYGKSSLVIRLVPVWSPVVEGEESD